MKRIIFLMVILVTLLLASSEIYRVIAREVMLNRAFTWQALPIYQQDASPKSVSMGFDYYSRAPMVAFYNLYTEKLRTATYVGSWLGDCGVNNSWHCVDRYSGGEYNDVANYLSPDNTYFATGIVYYDQSLNQLKYHFEYRDSDDGDGSADYSVYSFGPDYTIGSQPSLALDTDGNAHIAYIVDSLSSGWLYYTLESEAAAVHGTLKQVSQTWETTTILASSIAADPSIAYSSDGNPVIAYDDTAADALGYAYPSIQLPNCGGGEWRCITIDDQYATGKSPAIAIGEATYIAYYNSFTGILWLAKYVSNNGNCGMDWNGFNDVYRWQCDPIDDVGEGISDMAISLVVDGTEPVIAYRDANDFTHTSIKVAQTNEKSGVTVGNCGPGNSWYCQTILQPYDDFGSDIDMAISKPGALHIAFLEAWDPALNHLWVARQFFISFIPLLNK